MKNKTKQQLIDLSEFAGCYSKKGLENEMLRSKKRKSWFKLVEWN